MAWYLTYFSMANYILWHFLEVWTLLRVGREEGERKSSQIVALPGFYSKLPPTTYLNISHWALKIDLSFSIFISQSDISPF